MGARGWSPMAGVWGMCPPDLTPWPPSLRGKGENLAGFSAGGEVNTQNAGEPSANEGGQRGWRGRSPLPGGLGDVPPKFSNKGRAANSCHPATSGAQNAGKPSANEGGKNGGLGGRSPHGGGLGVCPPDLKPRHEDAPFKGRGLRLNPKSSQLGLA